MSLPKKKKKNISIRSFSGVQLSNENGAPSQSKQTIVPKTNKTNNEPSNLIKDLKISSNTNNHDNTKTIDNKIKPLTNIFVLPIEHMIASFLFGDFSWKEIHETAYKLNENAKLEPKCNYIVSLFDYRIYDHLSVSHVKNVKQFFKKHGPNFDVLLSSIEHSVIITIRGDSINTLHANILLLFTDPFF